MACTFEYRWGGHIFYNKRMVISMTYYIIENDKSNYSYYTLLDLCLRYCKECILVTRNSLGIGDNCDLILSELESHLIDLEYTTEWPGTQILGEQARVYYYTLSTQTIAILKKYSNNLECWIQPKLPEDLCFFKSEKTPWFVSITHEEEFYFINLTQEEINEIERIGINLRCIILNE
jgi:hypothetical protein